MIRSAYEEAQNVESEKEHIQKVSKELLNVLAKYESSHNSAGEKLFYFNVRKMITNYTGQATHILNEKFDNL